MAEHTSPDTTASGNEAAKQKQPWYQRSLFWALIGLHIGVLLMFLLTQCTGPSPTAGTDPPAPLAEPPAPAGPGGITPAELLELQRAYNKSLEEELQRLEALRNQDPCTVAESLGLSPEKAPAPALVPQQPPDSGAVSPEGPQSAPARPDAGKAPSLDSKGAKPIVAMPEPATLADLMEQTTVFILAADGDGVRSGSGFFVAPGLILTNRHVAGSAGASTVVGNKALGGMHQAQTIAVSNDETRDYALIRLADAAGKTPVLPVSDKAGRTMRVSAWGFPDLVVTADPKLRALLSGDAGAAPEVVYSEGVVSAVLDRTPPFIMHTAQLSQGNSGGPLIDDKGNVVGINTMIRKGEDSYMQAGVALSGSDVMRFLKENGITPAVPVQKEGK